MQPTTDKPSATPALGTLTDPRQVPPTPGYRYDVLLRSASMHHDLLYKSGGGYPAGFYFDGNRKYIQVRQVFLCRLVKYV